MIELTKKDIKYIEDNLQEFTIVKIARKLSAGKTDIIRRKDIVEYFKEKLDRDILEEKFGKK